jgi:hypothetical protein
MCCYHVRYAVGQKQVPVDTIPDAIWARLSQPELRTLREIPLPAYGLPDNPSGLMSVKAGMYDPTHPSAGGRAREAWTTLAFRVPASSEGSGAAVGRLVFDTERLRPLLGDPPEERRGASLARTWQREGAVQFANIGEAPDIEALSTLVQGLHLVIDQVLLGGVPHQALVALLPEPPPQAHTALIRLYGGPAFVRVAARAISLHQVLALIEHATDVQTQPDLLLQYDRELGALNGMTARSGVGK